MDVIIWRGIELVSFLCVMIPPRVFSSFVKKDISEKKHQLKTLQNF